MAKKFMLSIENMEAQIGKTRNESAPVFFIINQFFSDAEMPRLYAAATHYWSMSCGEGWDNTMIEAAATELQLIAPNHSAYATYLDESLANLIPSRCTPAKFRWSDGSHKLFWGADWWEPDKDTAADYIYNAINNGSVERTMGARMRIAEEFNWRKATTRLIEILEEISNTPAKMTDGTGYKWQKLFYRIVRKVFYRNN